MENYSNSDTSSESDYVAGESGAVLSDDEEEPSKNLEPERDINDDDRYLNAPWNPDAQMQFQLKARQLAQLHKEIKARAEIPIPIYPKLLRS
jgi:hypothetical protein